MKIIYTLAEWRKFVIDALRRLWEGFRNLLWSFVAGLISLCEYLNRVATAFIAREPKVAFVFLIIFALLFSLLIGCFVFERTARVRAEEQRDKYSLQIDSLKQYIISGNNLTSAELGDTIQW